jgi:hypothetical protein
MVLGVFFLGKSCKKWREITRLFKCSIKNFSKYILINHLEGALTVSWYCIHAFPCLLNYLKSTYEVSTPQKALYQMPFVESLQVVGRHSSMQKLWENTGSAPTELPEENNDVSEEGLWFGGKRTFVKEIINGIIDSARHGTLLRLKKKYSHHPCKCLTYIYLCHLSWDLPIDILTRFHVLFVIYFCYNSLISLFNPQSYFYLFISFYLIFLSKSIWIFNEYTWNMHESMKIMWILWKSPHNVRT